MNVRKPADYGVMFTVLNTLMAANLPQMELYCEIGRLVSGRLEKGAAVAAAEYLSGTYPAASGFSPRNVRRMREFYRTYESNLTVMAEAMTIGWTQNVVIMEAELTVQERAWYIRATSQLKWSKLELQRKIAANAHMEISLDITDAVCYTEEKVVTEETSGYVAAQDSQCYGAGNSGSADGFPAVFCLLCPQFLHRAIYFQPLLVRGRCRRTVEVADGSSVSGCGGLRQTLFQESGTGQPGVVSGSRQLPLQWGRLRCPLQGGNVRLSEKMRYGRATPGRVNAVQGSETDGWLRHRWPQGSRYSNGQSANVDLRYSPQLRVCS
ncbi:MAG: DUF1016 domain-containing protein [Oscillibacter sp.]|nr:DUF1016 domain-containing protein [Oscillibacter sp.]